MIGTGLAYVGVVVRHVDAVAAILERDFQLSRSRCAIGSTGRHAPVFPVGRTAVALFELLEQRKSEVEEIIRTVSGFRAYTLIRTGDGGITVTVCQDKAGTDQSLQVARDWIRQNASDLSTNPPAVSEGPVVLQLS